MAADDRELVIFNLERTIADAIYGDALQDVSNLGIGPEVTDETFPRNVTEQRETFFSWVKTDGGVHFDELMQRTVDLSPYRIAWWAQVVMRDQVQVGRNLAIFSGGVAHDLVKAYAEGVQASVLGTETPVLALGRRFVEVDGRRTDMTRSFNKEAMAEKLKLRGVKIALIADSFVEASGFMEQAERKIYSNVTNDPALGQQTRLYWWKEKPEIVRLLTAAEPVNVGSIDIAEASGTLFDLTEQADVDAFVAALRQGDPAFDA